MEFVTANWCCREKWFRLDQAVTKLTCGDDDCNVQHAAKSWSMRGAPEQPAHGNAVGILFAWYGFSPLQEVAPILGNGLGIQGQNYIVWLQGSKMLVEFYYIKLIEGI